MPEGDVDSEPTNISSVRSRDGRGTRAPSSETDETNPHLSASAPLTFRHNDVGERLMNTSDEQLDNAPFGIIRLDDDGTVQFFNRYESALSGVSPAEAEGRNFFTQVAPCTNNWLFRGRFRKGVRRDDLDETFTYTYTYEMTPTLVEVHLYRDASKDNWIMVQEH